MWLVSVPQDLPHPAGMCVALGYRPLSTRAAWEHHQLEVWPRTQHISGSLLHQMMQLCPLLLDESLVWG